MGVVSEPTGVSVVTGVLVSSEGFAARLLVLSPKTVPGDELLSTFFGNKKRVRKSNRLLGGASCLTVVPNTTGETMLITFGFSEIE